MQQKREKKRKHIQNIDDNFVFAYIASFDTIQYK